MSKYKILIADDDVTVLKSLKALLENEYPVEVSIFTDASKLLARYKDQYKEVAAILLDCHWGVDNPLGIEIAKRIYEFDSDAEILMMSKDLERSTLKAAYQRGHISGFLDKPLDPELVLKSIKNCFAKFDQIKRFVRADQQSFYQSQIRRMGIEGTSEALADIWKTIERLQNSKSTVLVLGENGTGKEAIAKSIHIHSPLSSGAFIPVNCGAIPTNLIESELFGHKKGSFTGAIKDAPGKFLAATNGTLFLDEVGELPLDAQVKLLRALQEKEITPVGSSNPIPVNVRIIAATNKDLYQMTLRGEFREDLYFRLNVVPVHIPALRDRPEDIKPILLNEMKKYPDGPQRILQTTLAIMESYQWPGNVRELVNLVERWANLVKMEEVHPVHLDASFFGEPIHTETKHKSEIAEVSSNLRRKRIFDNIIHAKSIRDLAKKMGVANSTAQAWLKQEGIDFFEIKGQMSIGVRDA